MQQNYCTDSPFNPPDENETRCLTPYSLFFEFTNNESCRSVEKSRHIMRPSSLNGGRSADPSAHRTR